MAKIYANYEVYSEWDLEEICDDLDIVREQIKGYYVKWDELVLTYVDDDDVEHTVELNPTGFLPASSFDWKHPVSVEELETE